jgi:hypothetical protein
MRGFANFLHRWRYWIMLAQALRVFYALWYRGK